jgi:hypothetical protein
MRLCRSCLQLRRTLRAGFCESCVMSTPREIARQHDRRIRQLRRHRWLLTQDLKATECNPRAGANCRPAQGNRSSKLAAASEESSSTPRARHDGRTRRAAMTPIEENPLASEIDDRRSNLRGMPEY